MMERNEIIAIAVAVLVIGAAAYFYYSQPQPPQATQAPDNPELRQFSEALKAEFRPKENIVLSAPFIDILSGFSTSSYSWAFPGGKYTGGIDFPSWDVVCPGKNCDLFRAGQASGNNVSSTFVEVVLNREEQLSESSAQALLNAYFQPTKREWKCESGDFGFRCMAFWSEEGEQWAATVVNKELDDEKTYTFVSISRYVDLNEP